MADARAAGAEQFVLGGDYALAGAFPQESVKALEQARCGMDQGQHRPLARGALRRPRRRAAASLDRVLPRPARREADREALPAAGPDGGRRRVRLPRLSAQRHADLHAGTDRRRPASCWPHTDAEVVIFGHSHIQFAREAEGGRLLVNPGSVGPSLRRRSPRRIRAVARRPRVRAAPHRIRLGRLRARHAGADGRNARPRRRDTGAADRAGRPGLMSGGGR